VRKFVFIADQGEDNWLHW